jgi:small GTP-binding protein
MRRFMGAVNWQTAQDDVRGEMRHKVAILGLANSGKSTLFNTLRGRYESAVAAEEGTTKTMVRGEFGPFQLIDTPGHLPDVQDQAVEEAAAVVYLLDASQGLRAQDTTIISKLRLSEKPLVVALNKADLLRDGADEASAEAAARLHIRDVIPISSRTGDNIGEELIPAIIETSQEAALAIGRALPQYRRRAANKLVRTAAMVSLVAGLEPIPLIDIPVLLANQIRLVVRIAALYSEPLGSKPTRELFGTVGMGLFFRYLAEQAAKAVPFGGDLISGAIAGAGTWALGQVAVEYFEGGKQLSSTQLRELFTRLYSRYRSEGVGDELFDEALKQQQQQSSRVTYSIREEPPTPVDSDERVYP